MPAIPTKEQLIWQDMELGVIIHYLMDIYNPTANPKLSTVRDELPPSCFAPQGWDTDQWIRSAHEMGAKYAVLVANHCTGFSLWQTKDNPYSVAGCAYGDGKGDIVRDFIASCRKYGLKPGLYYSTGCNGYYGINDEKMNDETFATAWYHDYVKHVEAQVTELWSQYGDLFEIWFDGGIVPLEKGGPNLVPILKKYQPNALCFQGPKGYPHNLRWVGNEDGLAPADCWAATFAGENRFDGTKPNEEAGCGDPDGIYYAPAETDMPNRDHLAFGGGWAWKPGQTDHVFSAKHLLDCYLHSVGRNSNLLLGMAIGKDGRFEDEEQFRSFGKLLQDTFGDGARRGYAVGSACLTQTVTLPAPADISYVVLREDMTQGHRIRGFRVLFDGVEAATGHCIGHKRILPLVGKNVTAVTIELTKTVDGATLRDIAVY